MTLKEKPALINFCKNSNLIASVLLISLFSSCVSQREIEYLQDKNKNIKAFDEAEFPITNLNPMMNCIFRSAVLMKLPPIYFPMHNNNLGYTGTLSPYGASLLSYSVDKEGFLLYL